MLRYIPEQCRTDLLDGENLKSRINLRQHLELFIYIDML
jgi:hypothetical protein